MPLSSAPRAAPHAALCCDSPNTVHSFQLAPEHNPPRRGISWRARPRLRGSDSRRGLTRFLNPRFLRPGQSRIRTPNVALGRHGPVLLTVLSPARALPPQAREVAAWLLLRNQLLERAVEGGSVVDSRRSSRHSASNNLACPAGPRPVPGVTPPGCGTRLSHSALGGGAGARFRTRWCERVTQEPLVHGLTSNGRGHSN